MYSRPQFDQVALDCRNHFLARISILHSDLRIPHSAIAHHQHCTVLLVTHDNRILDIAERNLHIEDGRLCA